jgi:hypothetical protein
LPLAEALARGRAVVALHGEKIRGGYALQRIEGGDQPKWLLLKVDDAAADARSNPVSSEPRSVASSRALEEIANNKDGARCLALGRVGGHDG